MDSSCNCLHLPYLDGASFSGYRSEPQPVPGSNETLYFRGIRNLDAVLDWAFENTAIAHATEVVLTGVSAGGLSTFLHADRVAYRIRAGSLGGNPRITANPHVGFFLDHDNFLHTDGYSVGHLFGGPNTPQWSTPGTAANYTFWMKYIYTMQNVSHPSVDSCDNFD